MKRLKQKHTILWYAGPYFMLLLLGSCDTLTESASGPELEMNTPETTSPQAVILNDDAPLGCIREQNTSIYQVCVPAIWNGVLAVYAHGYVSPYEPLHLPSEADHVLSDGEAFDLSQVVISQGAAFAVTSYPYNGLVRPADAVEDYENLIGFFNDNSLFPPAFVILAGASEGGLHTTLAVEQRPDLFQAGLATCGPYGDFSAQINYFGDVRLLFDYFFPNVLPGNPLIIPQVLIDDWEEIYIPAIVAAMSADPGATAQFLNVINGLSILDETNPDVVASNVIDVLWYNVFATNDAIEKLGGQPYDNMDREYTGSLDDVMLNKKIKRYEIKKKAFEEINAHYQTSRSLTSPLVMMHTEGDHIVPFNHLESYKAEVQGPFFYNPVTPGQTGHCDFTVDELLTGFSILLPPPPPL